MKVTSFSVQGDHAQAQVEFTPKNAPPQGAGMQVAYSLQKQNALRGVVQEDSEAAASSAGQSQCSIRPRAKVRTQMKLRHRRIQCRTFAISFPEMEMETRAGIPMLFLRDMLP